MKKYAVDTQYEGGHYERFCYYRLQEALAFYLKQADYSELMVYRPNPSRWEKIEDNQAQLDYAEMMEARS